MTSIHIVVVLSAIISALGVAVYACLWDIKRYRKENMALRGEIQNAAARLEHLRRYTEKNKLIEEAANEERKSLNETSDGGLAGRANNLFGVRNGADGGDAA
jgi:Tfp pilus assembly protein PilN